MGLTYSNTKHLSLNDIDAIVNLGNPQIEEYYNKVKHREYGSITFEIFQLMTCLKPEIAKALFDLCCASNGKMYLSDLKYFYALIASPYVHHKVLFLSLLLFASKNEIREELYVTNCLTFLLYFPHFNSVTDGKFIASIRSYQRVLSRLEFVKRFPVKDLSASSFLKKEVDTTSAKFHIDNSLSYHCRCFQLTKTDFLKENKVNVEYDQMKAVFQSIEKMNEGLFPLSQFDKMMREIKVHPILIKAISGYLKRKMMNSFIFFDPFCNFLLKFTHNEEEKVELLFELLSYPKQYIQVSDFKDHLPKSATVIETISKEDFIKLYQEELSMKELVNSMNKLNAIPNIFFNVIPKKTYDKLICLGIAMRGLSFDAFLQEHIVTEEEFFCITGAFIRKIEEYSSSTISTSHSANLYLPYIDLNALIDDNNNLRRDLIYKKDFFICTKSIFSLISKWFGLSGSALLFKKITYEKDTISKVIDVFYYPTSSNVVSKVSEGIVHEIELYPVYIKFCSLESIYQRNKDLTMSKLLSLLNDIVNGIYVCETRGSKYSRRQIIGEFKTIVRLGGRDDVMFNILLYYNNKLYQPDYNSTLEDQKIVDSCLMILDPNKGDKFHLDLLAEPNELAPTMQSSLFSSQKDSSLNQPNASSTNAIKEENSISTKETTEAPIGSKIDSKGIRKDRKCSPIGIGNIGNSCYLSSVLQIIINLPILKDILLLPQIPLLLNQHSKFSHNGILVNELIDLLKKRWTIDEEKEIKIINPSNLKIASGKVHPQFNNSEQQDANEFLTFLLDECNEEINLKADKQYIPNPEQGSTPQEALSSIYWANAMRRSTSFINSLFLFQLKSRLICCECFYEKISFETSSNLFLPIPLNPSIQLKILLFRLPFEYKAYYHKINKQFSDHIDALNETNKNGSMTLLEAMRDYSATAIENDDLSSSSTPIKFEIQVERKLSVEDLVKRIRGIEFLQLEPANRVRREDNEDISIDEVNEDTYFAITSYSPSFINHQLKIDACFQDSQTLKIYELLNSNGLRKLSRQANDINAHHQPLVMHHNVKCSIKKYESVYQQAQSPQSKERINSVQNWIAYYSQDNYSKDNIRLHKQTEYIIPIQHCFQIKSNSYLFYKSAYSPIQFPDDYLLVNNSNQNTSARFIYDYIWAKYKRFMKNPNVIQSKLWWQSIESNYRLCYPFQIKWVKQYINHKKIYQCSQCQYYSFCAGCVIDPFSKDNLFFDSDSVLLVVWCSLIYENELMQNSLNYCIVKADLIETQSQNEKETTLEECINLFTEKEKLDANITCDQCKSLQLFTKNFQIDKVSYTLVISLNRFKYATLYNKKIATLVKFPLYDFKLKEEVYDLYGVINHFGSMNSGHYTSVIKIEGKWLNFDDAKFCEIPEHKVISKDAYILVYLSKRDIKEWDYYKMMMSIINQMNQKKEGEEYEDCYEPEWTFGQPVITSLGEGYFVGVKDEEIEVYLNETGMQFFK